MSDSLFLEEPQLVFEKRAAIPLDEDTEKWTRQVLVELYKVLPSITDYVPQVLFTKVDKEQGTAFGAIIVSASSDSALRTANPSTPSPKAIIPLIISNYQLSPLDILMFKSGKMTPLTEQRLREALFRPDHFEVMTNDLGPNSLYNLFYPPGRSNNSFGSGVGMGEGGGEAGVSRIFGSGMKFSSAETALPLLEALSPTVLSTDIRRIEREFDKEAALLGAMENDAFCAAIKKLSSAEETVVHADDRISQMLEDAVPDVVQIGSDHRTGEYWVKVAARDIYHPTVGWMDRKDAIKFASNEIIRKVDIEGTVTVSKPEVEAEHHSVDSEKWKTIQEPGVYKVCTKGGDELVGLVIPSTIDPDGVSSPLAVFANGSSVCVQSEIAGASPISQAMAIPASEPKGMGVFVVQGSEGIAATTPLTVLGEALESAGHSSYLCKTLMGEDVKVDLIPGLRALVAAGDEYAVPTSAKFISLDKEAVPLLSTPSELTKTSAYADRSRVYAWKDGGGSMHFSFVGAPKLASAVPSEPTYDEAIFGLCLGGYGAKEAHDFCANLGQIKKSMPINDITPVQDVIMESKVAYDVDAILGLREYLLKEAAAMPNALTVDSVLSLQFVNPENIAIFMSYMPYLDKALSQIGELLLAARLGITEIPEGASARAFRALDSVLQGLRALTLRAVDDQA